jgi:hypothetical protein
VLTTVRAWILSVKGRRPRRTARPGSQRDAAGAPSGRCRHTFAADRPYTFWDVRVTGAVAPAGDVAGTVAAANSAAA